MSTGGFNTPMAGVDPLLDQLTAVIHTVCQPHSLIIILQKDQAFRTIRHLGAGRPPELWTPDMALLEHFIQQPPPNAALLLSQAQPPPDHPASAQLAAFGSVCLPLQFEAALLGLVILHPQPETELSPRDILWLEQICSAFAHQIHTAMLREQMDLIGYVSRGLSHDFHNLLTPIATLLQLAAEQPNLPAKLAELLPTAKQNIATLKLLITESLLFSKSRDIGQQTIQLQPLIDRVCSLVEPIAQTRGVTVRVEMPGGGLHARTNPALCLRLLYNLVLNAVEASPANASVTVRAVPTPAGARIEVQDQGPGLQLESVQETAPAYSSAKDLKTRGLGLAACSRIASALQSQLKFFSPAAGGTIATVTVDSAAP